MSISLFFFLLAILSLVGVVITLFYGLFAPRRDVADSRKSNKAMQYRVWLQGAVIFFLILSALSK